MKLRTLLTMAMLLFVKAATAQTDTMQMIYDSLESKFKFQTGVIKLKDNIGTVTVPAGFKYLDAESSHYLLTDLWGNPPEQQTLGIIFPAGKSVFDTTSVAYNIQYEAIGYVKDDDADDLNYDELLKQMQEDEVTENAEREKAGFESIHLVGWAQKPFYDKDKKVLHWAQELKFGNAAINTLNYNIRILGRKGVLVVNAISDIRQLSQVNQHTAAMIGAVQFNDGYKYAQFDSKTDEVAAWTIGGLIAGKVLAKVGLFAVIAKFGKIIIVAIIAAAAAAWRFITGKKKKQAEKAESLPETETDSES